MVTTKLQDLPSSFLIHSSSSSPSLLFSLHVSLVHIVPPPLSQYILLSQQVSNVVRMFKLKIDYVNVLMTSEESSLDFLVF